MATFLRTRATIQDAGIGPAALLTYYWDSAGGTGAALTTEAIARVRAFWNSAAALIHSTASITFNLTSDEIEETTGAIVNQYVGAAPAAVTFTGGGDALPLATQSLMRLSSATFVNGRRVVGRQFLPYPTETANLNGGIPSTPAYVTPMTTAAALLGTTIVTPMTQRIWHRPGPSGAGLSVPVTSRSIAGSWATLKSRR